MGEYQADILHVSRCSGQGRLLLLQGGFFLVKDYCLCLEGLGGNRITEKVVQESRSEIHQIGKDECGIKF